MLGRADVLIAISNSGETQEILQLLPSCRAHGYSCRVDDGAHDFDAGQEQ